MRRSAPSRAVRAASSTEYGLIAAGIAIACIVGWGTVGKRLFYLLFMTTMPFGNGGVPFGIANEFAERGFQDYSGPDQLMTVGEMQSMKDELCPWQPCEGDVTPNFNEADVNQNGTLVKLEFKDYIVARLMGPP